MVALMVKVRNPSQVTQETFKRPAGLFRPRRLILIAYATAALAFLLVTVAHAQNSQFLFDRTGNLLAQTSETTALPKILGQPQLQVVMPGELASFSVVLADTRGVFYQWRFNGANITGANQDALLLTHVSTNNEGLYSVFIANGSGNVVSASAALMIDSRGCGMPDSWQQAHFVNLNQNSDGDFDHDGVSNLDEFLEGTDPANAASYHPRLGLRSTPNGQAFASPGGLAYYTLGQIVTLRAAPDDSVAFLGWSGSATGTKIQISLVMTGHKAVAASFSQPLPPQQLIPAVIGSDGTFHLTWSAIPGRTYQIQYKTDLDQAEWDNLGGPIIASALTITTNDPIGANVRRFYRVGLLP